MAHELEERIAEQVRYVRLAARKQIVDAQHVVSRLQQGIAKMRAQKSGTAGDENFLHAGILTNWLLESLRMLSQC
jgi:hypothetical protein